MDNFLSISMFELEEARMFHEDLELLEQLLSQVLLDNKFDYKEQVLQQHRAKNIIDSIVATTSRLVDLYQNRHQQQQESHDDRGSEPLPAIFTAFDHRLREILASSNSINYVNDMMTTMDDYKRELLEGPIRVKFSGEEAFGRFLDLHSIYNQFVYPRLVVNVDVPENESTFGYLEYLKELLLNNIALNNIGQDLGFTKDYPRYLLNLKQYFMSFLERTQPLKDIHKIMASIEVEFERKHFNVAPVHNCSRINAKNVALLEMNVRQLCELLHDVIEDTIAYVERKQVLTYKEMELEIKDVVEQVSNIESHEEERKMTNPLKVPLGISGKPIPYWLYKLHGLDCEYKCEICGDHSYRGRRAFEKHFKEGRHQHGMQHLGIPNTKSFHEITTIKDAKLLWSKIQKREEENKWQPELVEEYEDSEGNVYNKRTYTLLKRQGLL